MQRHVLEHHGQLLHVLAQGARQRPPDQAQVAGGREEDTAIDAVVHQVVVGGLGAGVCATQASVPMPGGRGAPRPPTHAPGSPML